MSLSVIAAAVLAGLPLVFMPSYISENITFEKPLSEEEERQWMEQFLKGNEKEKAEARDLLIRRNMRLVAHIAGKYAGGRTSQGDLISIGSIGLMKAVASYRPERAPRLGPYASRCIENEIRMWLRKTKNEGLELSINEPLGTDRDGNDIHFQDILGTDENPVTDDIERKLEIADLYHAIESELTPREQMILIHRFGLFGRAECTQKELAARMGISRSYVSRIEKHAIEKLRCAIQGRVWQ